MSQHYNHSSLNRHSLPSGPGMLADGHPRKRNKLLKMYGYMEQIQYDELCMLGSKVKCMVYAVNVNQKDPYNCVP